MGERRVRTREIPCRTPLGDSATVFEVQVTPDGMVDWALDWEDDAGNRVTIDGRRGFRLVDGTQVERLDVAPDERLWSKRELTYGLHSLRVRVDEWTPRPGSMIDGRARYVFAEREGFLLDLHGDGSELLVPPSTKYFRVDI